MFPIDVDFKWHLTSYSCTAPPLALVAELRENVTFDVYSEPLLAKMAPPPSVLLLLTDVVQSAKVELDSTRVPSELMAPPLALELKSEIVTP